MQAKERARRAGDKPTPTDREIEADRETQAKERARRALDTPTPTDSIERHPQIPS